MLAEVTSVPVGLAAWLGCAAFVIVLLNNGLKLIDRIKGKPSPGEVRSEAHEKFLPRDEFAGHEKWDVEQHEALRKQLEKDREDNQIHISSRQKTLFGELKDSREKLEKKIDDRCDKQDRRIERTMLGVAALCARQNIKMPEES